VANCGQAARERADGGPTSLAGTLPLAPPLPTTPAPHYPTTYRATTLNTALRLLLDIFATDGLRHLYCAYLMTHWQHYLTPGYSLPPAFLAEPALVRAYYCVAAAITIFMPGSLYHFSHLFPA